MEFIKITETEYSNFLDNYKDKDFLNTPAIGKNHQDVGYTLEYFGITNEEKLQAAMMLVIKNGMAYIPRGFLVDYNNYDLLNFLVTNLKRYLINNKCYVLTIDPRLIYHERDINGDIVVDGINNIKVVNNLEKLGFKKVKKPVQMSWQFAMDFNDVKAEDILKNMRSFTKRNLKKGLHNEIEIRKLDYNDIHIVKELVDITGERKHFDNRDLEYFQHMYKNFGDKIEFLVASLKIPKYLNILKRDLELEQKELDKAIAKNSDGKIKNYQDSVASINKKIDEALELQKQYGDSLDISGGVFINYGDEVTYLFGGNRKEYLHFCSAYVLQWHKINYAIDNHFKRYNFYGISDNFDKNSKDYGVYDFKKGFGGYVIELIGEFDLILGNKYYTKKAIRKTKDLIKKLIKR